MVILTIITERKQAEEDLRLAKEAVEAAKNLRYYCRPRNRGTVGCRRVEGLSDGPNGGGRITISCGIAEILPQDDDLDQLIKRADQALYAAKNTGHR